MGIVFRQSIKSTIAIFTGVSLGALFNFIAPFVLSQVELGSYTNIIFTGVMLQLVAIMGTGPLIRVFIQRYEEGSEKRKVLITFSFAITAATSCILALLFHVFKPQIISLYQPADRPIISKYYYWLPVLVLLWGFITLLDNYLLAHIKVAVSAFTKEVVLRLFTFGLLVLMFYNIVGYDMFIAGSVLAHILPVLILFTIAARTGGFGFSVNWKAFSGKEYREFVHFAWYHLLLDLSISGMGYIDALMLGALDNGGMETLAVYRIAVFIATLMTIPYRAISTSSYAVLNEAYLASDIPKLNNLFYRSGINMLLAATGMFILIACNLDNAVRIFPKGYEAIKPVVLILMLGRWIDMATGLNNELISISKYYKFSFRISLLLLVLLILLNRILIPDWGIYGAAWGTTFALIAFNAGKVAFLWKKMHMHPFSKKSIVVVICGIAAGLVGYVIPFIYDELIDFIIRSAIIVIIYTSLLVIFRVSDDLNEYLSHIRANRKIY
jgi:O-antigen/teichoic acid export membrane protein